MAIIHDPKKNVIAYGGIEGHENGKIRHVKCAYHNPRQLISLEDCSLQVPENESQC